MLAKRYTTNPMKKKPKTPQVPKPTPAPKPPKKDGSVLVKPKN